MDNNIFMICLIAFGYIGAGYLVYLLILFKDKTLEPDDMETLLMIIALWPLGTLVFLASLPLKYMKLLHLKIVKIRDKK